MDKYIRYNVSKSKSGLPCSRSRLIRGKRTENPLHLLAATITAYIASDLFSLAPEKFIEGGYQRRGRRGGKH